MGRPAIKEENRRQTRCISVPREVLDMADAAGNSSKFFEVSVFSMKAISELLSSLNDKKITMEDFMEDLGDIATVWNSQSDETLAFEEFKRRLGK